MLIGVTWIVGRVNCFISLCTGAIEIGMSTVAMFCNVLSELIV